ncbi:MAG: histidine kinase [Anaerolineales bacterium]|nr:histidine kinase [Anaerolineales bacterium]
MYQIELGQLLLNAISITAPKIGFALDPAFLLLALPPIAWLSDRSRRDRNKSPNSSQNHGGDKTNRVASLEREIEKLRSLLVMTANLNATLNYERVLEMTLDLANSALEDKGEKKLISALMLFENEELYITSARGLSAADLRVTLPGERGVVGEALASVQSQLCKNPGQDVELKRIITLHNCRAAVCIPLVVGLVLYGALLFAHPDEEYFNPEQIELLDAIAQQAMVALQNARLYNDLEQEKERIAEIQENARNKLARDLHDGPTQSIGAIAMRVNFARRLLQREPDQAAEELFKIEELARRTTKEIRQMLFTLRPLVLESEGLLGALEQLSEKMMENQGQNVVVEAKNGIVDDMEVGKQGVIFFIVEEAVNNARKHANAKHIWIRLKRRGDTLLLEIEDDGVGFNVEQVQANYEKRGSLGMVNLYERAELVNGILKIDSQPGRGTRILVTIPATIEAAEKLHQAGFVA